MEPLYDPSTAPICVCGQQMVERSGPHGRFYGCRDYPKCQHTESVGDE